MEKILLTNIQRFSLHDGPGIRTTVFLKGCGLRCPWCSNPENIFPVQEKYIKDGIEGTYGKFYSLEELYKEVVKDKTFYSGEIDPSHWHGIDFANLEKLPGGVTFSGGECLFQSEVLLPLWERLNAEQIHTVIETCLFVPSHLFSVAIEHIDLFYVDVKILDPIRCSQDLHGNLDLYLGNLEQLLNSNRPVVIRVPVIGGFTDDGENMRAVKKLLKGKPILKIELIKEHNLGLSKYQSLIDAGAAIALPDYRGVTDELMEAYKRELNDLGIPVEVCKI